MNAVPSPWVGLILGLAAYRLTRLGGWDDWPPIYKLRSWIIGERWIVESETFVSPDGGVLTAARGVILDTPPGWTRGEQGTLDLPGKQPDSEVDGVRPAYDRPLLAHLVHCPFCLSFWISLGVYGAWIWQPKWTIIALFPFVLSGFAGLVAKNLDA